MYYKALDVRLRLLKSLLLMRLSTQSVRVEPNLPTYRGKSEKIREVVELLRTYTHEKLLLDLNYIL